MPNPRLWPGHSTHQTGAIYPKALTPGPFHASRHISSPYDTKPVILIVAVAFGKTTSLLSAVGELA